MTDKDLVSTKDRVICTQCKNFVANGFSTCFKHTDRESFADVQSYQQAAVDSARLKLLAFVGDAVENLIDLAENSEVDAVRLKANTEAMDRVGLRGGYEMTSTVQIVNTAEEMNRRLEEYFPKNPIIVDKAIILKSKQELEEELEYAEIVEDAVPVVETVKVVEVDN